LAYLPVSHFEFVNFDDNIYVTDNFHVQNGLSWENTVWAFTSLDKYLWNPLTWLSYMLDFELYGLNAGGYHLTNVVIHLMSTVMLFLLLFRMTGEAPKSWFAAGLFALHPLHVESVAWIAERKDVLSGFFWICALLAYVHYTSAASLKRYLGVVVLFILGLMSKPMVVTLPAVMWILDYWPLRRFPGTSIYRLIMEKVPLLALAALITAITFYTQSHSGAMESLDRYPLDVRIWNALVSYAEYLWKMIWPTGLAVYYPHPRTWPVWRITIAGLVMISISFLAYRTRTRWPYLAAGWCWYIVTLLPVIGIIQIGGQAMADRYTYIPLIGLFISLSWGLSDIISATKRKEMLFGTISVVILALCSVMTIKQVPTWKDSATLFRHALAVTDRSKVAHYNLGIALKDKGLYLEAVNEFHAALALAPNDAKIHNNMGIALILQGNTNDAEKAFRTVLLLDPNHAGAHNNLGMILYNQDHLNEAINHFREAIRLRPDFANAHYYLGLALQKTGHTSEALHHLSTAARLNPAFGIKPGKVENRLDEKKK
jgi:tetratricopeptide (TPR) repeat protein